MNQKLMLTLVPIIFLVALIIFYRSYQVADSAPSNISNEILPTLIKNQTNVSFLNSAVSDKPVHVDFYVMSKCPDARKCELLFLPSLLKLSSIVNLTVSFIGSEPRSNEFDCMHGPGECLGNKQQLCVQKHAPQTKFIQYLQCQSKHIENIPDNGEQCVKEVADEQLKWSDIQTCLDSNQANELLHQSLDKTHAASVSKSCTIHLNGKFWCMHDGGFYGCSEGRDEKSFIKSICSRYIGPNTPVECAAVSV